MPRLPRRISLIDETAAALRQRIDEGDWCVHLPGEMELATLLQVGRNTVRAALQALENEGRLRTRNGLRREVVARPDTTAPERRAVLLMSKPENEFPPSTSAWVSEVRTRLENLAWNFRILVEPDLYRGKSDALLRALVAGSPASTWILHRSTPAIQRWFQERRQVAVLAGSRHKGILLPQVEVDLRAVSRHAAGRFLARGHERLAVLRPDGAFAGDAECVAAFREGAPRAQIVELRCRGGAPGVVEALRRHLRSRERATGLFVLHPDHCVTALSFLLSEGIRVPIDLSLICRDDEPYFSLLHPEPSRYRHNPRLFGAKLATLVSRADLRDSPAKRQALVMPRVVAGATLAGAPVPEKNR